MNGFSRNPIPQQDLTRITNFTNAVGLGNTAVAAAPFVAADTAGLTAITVPSEFTAGALTRTALTSGAVGGTTSGLSTLALGGSVRDVAVNTGAGFVAGLAAPFVPGSGFVGNFGKGSLLGFGTNIGVQSTDILSDSTKTFGSNFSVGQLAGSTLGGGLAQGLTGSFGNSIPEQMSAGIFSFGVTTPIDAVSQSLSTPSASGGFVLYPSKPNTNTLRTVYAK